MLKHHLHYQFENNDLNIDTDEDEGISKIKRKLTERLRSIVVD